MELKTIKNEYFLKFKQAIEMCFADLINDQTIISNLEDSSFNKQDNCHVFPADSELNLEAIKLDSITQYRKQFSNLSDSDKFEELPAVDAICINNQNEWFFIEFKDSDIRNGKTNKSLRKKMLSSLWFVFSICSHSGIDTKTLFGNDITKFAREHINYIIVATRSKNLTHFQNIQAFESAGEHYTPPGFAQYKNYYFKDIYMLTEIELKKFILDFKC